ncbi:AAA family ATPase [Paeniclostridium sordellii]|nr:AAA family ATPase [Paeniclostridium sordellii]MSB59584.1 AAA family ATPase [Paeniclostridium sordellii]
MQDEKISQYIRYITLDRENITNPNKYPFDLPVVKELDKLEFHPSVTFIIGENGSGKSTLLEAIAVAYGFNPEGGTKNFNFSTNDSHSNLHDYINLVKGFKRPVNGFFLRAETTYNLASNIDELDKQIFETKLIDSYGGISLHEQSHGESFFSIFLNRFGERGIYILDEPEAALSPSRQMAMLTRIKELVDLNCQFIISTHSPILMAYPDAIIYEIKDNKINQSKYEDTEHYQITHAFLNNKEKFLEILID